MATLSEFRSRVLRLISNPDGEGIDDALILDAINAAHYAILPWWPKQSVATITGDGTLNAYDLPTDFYGVESVIFEETGEIIGKNVFIPGQYYGEDTTQTNHWILNPSGQISFEKVPDSGDIYKLYYSALWTVPTSTWVGTEELEPPNWLMYGMSLYAGAYILMPDALGVAGIGTYRTKVDSGNPEHNPIEKAINFLLNLFNIEMNRHPKHQRSQT